MGRVGSAAYDFFTQRQQRVVGLDSDPGKVEWHRQAGRRVLYVDAEDPGFWLNLSLEGVEAILLAVPDFEAKTISAKQLRKAGFKGTLSATAVFNEEVAAIRGAGADFVYNYFDTVGVGFAEHVWLQLTPDKPAEVASSARPTAGMP
jgi:Trk K+ transport system NAD-binding subunit